LIAGNCTVYCSALLPVVRDKAAFADSIDVVREGQRDDVGLQAVDHGTGLLAGAAMRLPDRHVVARPGLVLARERGIEVLVQLTRRVVGHVQQRDVRRLCDGRTRQSGRDEGSGENRSERGRDLFIEHRFLSVECSQTAP